jgi:hypothetical protein
VRSSAACESISLVFGNGGCIVSGCDTRTDQRHHADYRADERWGHRRFPICDEHHAHLHRLWDGISRQIPLTLFTLNYVIDPQATALDAIALMAPASAQLSFAELPTRAGEHWRAWEAAELPDFEDWPEHEAA